MAKPPKLKLIKANAVQNSAQMELTVKQDEAYRKAYEKLVVDLNTNIEAELENFKSEALVILREAYQVRPAGCLNVAYEQIERIREVIPSLIAIMEPIKNPAFRESASGCLKNIIDICTQNVIDQYRNSEIISNMKLQ
jgi:hypothetical protein